MTVMRDSDKRVLQPWTPEFKAYWNGPGKNVDADPYATISEQSVWEMYDVHPNDAVMAKSLEWKRRHLESGETGPVTWAWEHVPSETNGGHLAPITSLADWRRVRT